ncbi:PAS domain S-box protein [Anoxynatronum buryatiense]|uniref:Circadian input-output histidine kinase CikA n=1 Tax=Anoxynatronum buryatiense TaxID=489973 RepID=A0AA45WYH5_9CLOT|nr:PAS domain S-box protein [Anoxynatronum buryatiense]SMP63513.1 PAS domain S-box-containing protein [Anoxynatronum buryatiense]
MKTIRIHQQHLNQLAIRYSKSCVQKEKWKILAEEADNRLHSVLNAIQDGIRVMDPQLIIRLQNETTRRLSKGRQELGLPCYQVHYGRQTPCDNCHVLEAMKTGRLVKKKEYYQNEDDRHIFEVFAYPVYNSEGALAGAVEYFRDITEIQTREESLEKSEARYRNIVENINDALYIHDFHGIILDVNQQACQMTGYQRDELIGSHLSDLLDPKAAVILPQEMTQLQRAGKAVFESADRHKNGSYIPVEVSVKVISYDGDGLIQSIVRDISERKQAEKQMKLTENRYETVTAVSEIGAWEYHHETKADWYSPTYFSMLGYEESAFLLPDGNGHINAWRALIHPQDMDRAVEYLENYVAGGSQGIYESSFRMKRRDGTWAWILSRGQTLQDEQGKLMGITLGTHVDISQLRQIQLELETKNQELALAKESADAANHAKTRFLTNMSHELRTPLNGLMGMLQLLKTTALTEEQVEFTQVALDGSLALTRVVNDILNYTRLTNMENIIHPITEAPFELDVLLQEIMDLHQVAAVHKGLTLSLNKENHLPNQLVGDRFKLIQILGNLMGNALKFTENGTVTLRIMQGEKTAASGRINIQFQVQDTGIGIPPDKMKYIFQHFSQADESHSRLHGGLGLGLTVAQEQAVTLGGSITAVSTPGAGSTFTLACELKLDQEVLQHSDKPVYSESFSKLNQLPSFKTLVVDDDYASRIMTQLFLEKLGCQVDTATHGEEALEMAIRYSYHLVLMDCQMPIMDGYEATRRIRYYEISTGRHTPIVAITAKTLPGDREECLNAGMDGFLSKPFNLSLLQSVIKRYAKA